MKNKFLSKREEIWWARQNIKYELVFRKTIKILDTYPYTYSIWTKLHISNLKKIVDVEEPIDVTFFNKAFTIQDFYQNSPTWSKN